MGRIIDRQASVLLCDNCLRVIHRVLWDNQLENEELRMSQIVMGNIRDFLGVRSPILEGVLNSYFHLPFLGLALGRLMNYFNYRIQSFALIPPQKIYLCVCFFKFLCNKLLCSQQLKITCIYYLTVSMGQASEHGLAGPSVQGLTRLQLRYQLSYILSQRFEWKRISFQTYSYYWQNLFL